VGVFLRVYRLIELNINLFSQVSGGAQIVADYTHSQGPGSYFYDSMSITLPADGSLPPEFQARIDAGATWEEMGPFLIMFSIIRTDHPELFQ